MERMKESDGAMTLYLSNEEVIKLVNELSKLNRDYPMLKELESKIWNG